MPYYWLSCVLFDGQRDHEDQGVERSGRRLHAIRIGRNDRVHECAPPVRTLTRGRDLLLGSARWRSRSSSPWRSLQPSSPSRAGELGGRASGAPPRRAPVRPPTWRSPSGTSPDSTSTCPGAGATAAATSSAPGRARATREDVASGSRDCAVAECEESAEVFFDTTELVH